MIAIVFIVFILLCMFALVSAIYQDRSVDRLLVVVAGVALIAIAGFRGIGVDQDSVGYLIYYNLTDDRMSLAAEPSFVIIAQISRILFPENGLRALFIFYAIVGVTLKFLAIKRLSNMFWLSVITYFSGYFLLHEFTQIRAGVACGCLMFGIYFAYRRKPIGFIISILIGTLFHYSALIAFPIYFLRNDLKLLTKISVAASIPLAILVRTLGINITTVLPIELVRNKIDTYSQVQSLTTIELNVFNLVYVVKYILIYVFLAFNKPIGERAPAFPLLLQLYALSMASYIILSYNSAFAIRISELFGVVEIVLIPMLVYAFRSPLPGVLAVVSLALGNLALGIYQTELIQPPL